MVPWQRLNTAQYKSALAAIGVGAAVAMGAMGLLAERPSEAGMPTAQASPPRMTLGATKTKAPPPSLPATPSAAPVVRALPAAGTRPGM
jgi:hypothetical protein